MSNRSDTLNWNVLATVEKWNDSADYEAGKAPDEVEEAKGNLLLNEGINRMLNLLIGGGGTNYNSTNARIGVGTSTVAAAKTQIGLQAAAASTAFKGMDSGFPSISGQTVSFKATFGDGEGNFAWQEWTIDNGATANENLNRKVVNLGTKTSGTWSLTVSIEIS